MAAGGKKVQTLVAFVTDQHESERRVASKQAQLKCKRGIANVGLRVVNGKTELQMSLKSSGGK